MFPQFRRSIVGSIFDDLVDRVFSGEPREERSNTTWIPRADISDEENEVIIDVELPGIKRENIRVEAKNGVLVISGERRSGRTVEPSGSSHFERHFGRFERSFTIPGSTDEEAISATYQGGVLTVHLPKMKKETRHEVTVAVHG